MSVQFERELQHRGAEVCLLLSSWAIENRRQNGGADDYIRISYATSMANLQKGCERIDKFVRSLK